MRQFPRFYGILPCKLFPWKWTLTKEVIFVREDGMSLDNNTSQLIFLQTIEISYINWNNSMYLVSSMAVLCRFSEKFITILGSNPPKLLSFKERQFNQSGLVFLCHYPYHFRDNLHQVSAIVAYSSLLLNYSCCWTLKQQSTQIKREKGRKRRTKESKKIEGKEREKKRKNKKNQ